MVGEEFKARQKAERDRCLDAILNSKAPKKLIVAGAGTGKTFTFIKVLENRAGGKNLAMTFIRKLVADMGAKLGASAEVKTFHAYCKKILHGQNGKVELAPFLTKVIEKDAEILENGLSQFDSKFQTLNEGSSALIFHLERGNYYEAVGFDDSVYRLYKTLQADPDVLPSFDQIVIDEFQDFHQLEVAFIEELSKKGDILIVGDDDQAVYHARNASPTHLRKIYDSPDFEKFALPFCSRCPEVIVRSTNRIIQRAQEAGHFQSRIAKQYECYLDAKEPDSIKYPKIILATCTVATVIARYVRCEIAKIDPHDIEESHVAGEEYPTALIIGTKQYLREVEKYFNKIGLPFIYTPADEITYGIVDAYEWLIQDDKSNLGWRILLDLFLDQKEQKRVIESSKKGVAIVTLLDPKFVANHLRATALIQAVRKQEQPISDVDAELRNILGEYFNEIAVHFSPKKMEEVMADKTKPTILLTSFVGCKGLSAGHVFIIGVHNGSIPCDPNRITDVEISQFIVALTRTRKQCQIVSNEWFIAMGKNGKWAPRYQQSVFVSWIPTELTEQRGKVNAKSLAG
jgi:superfamily I DNA/RNA helicase